MNKNIAKIFAVYMILVLTLIPACQSGSPLEDIEQTQAPSPTIASGTFIIECIDGDCPQNHLEIEFVPEGGKVRGAGIIEFDDGVVWEFEFKGSSSDDGTAIGAVAISYSEVTISHSWNGTFSDHTFSGEIVEQYGKQPPQFNLSY